MVPFLSSLIAKFTQVQIKEMFVTVIQLRFGFSSLWACQNPIYPLDNIKGKSVIVASLELKNDL